MVPEERYDLVKRNSQEILTDEELKELLAGKKRLSAYYGAATTGPFHIAYLIPLTKVFDFAKAGISTKILLADIHAILDDLKSSWDEIELKAKYYKKCIVHSLPWEEEPEIILGSSYQLNKDYCTDVLKLATHVTVNRATRAASEVTRMKNPKVSELVYPLMQALDEQYLDADIQIGGIDQRHIMALAREELPKLGYKPRIEVMTPLIASLKGAETKMSASLPDTHIKVYDSEQKIREKISKAYCLEGNANNAITQICQFIIFTLKNELTVERAKKFGGDIKFDSYSQLEEAFVNKALHPADLKKAVAEELIDVFSNARKYFDSHKEMLKELGKDFGDNG